MDSWIVHPHAHGMEKCSEASQDDMYSLTLNLWEFRVFVYNWPSHLYTQVRWGVSWVGGDIKYTERKVSVTDNTKMCVVITRNPAIDFILRAETYSNSQVLKLNWKMNLFLQVVLHYRLPDRLFFVLVLALTVFPSLLCSKISK